MRLVDKKPPSEPRASCPSLSSDGHGSCKPRVPHLTLLLLQSPSLSFPPMASSSTRSPDQPQYSTYTNVWQPNQRTPYVPTLAETQRLIESFFPFAFQHHPVCRQEGSAHKTCRFRTSLAKGYPI